jgi:4-oxalocrotonate tautomerase
MGHGVDRYDRENWATGGELHAGKFGPGYGKTRAQD